MKNKIRNVTKKQGVVGSIGALQVENERFTYGKYILKKWNILVQNKGNFRNKIKLK